MRRLISLVLWLSVGIMTLPFISCSKEKREEATHQEMGGHGMPAGWKFTLPKGDPVQGKKIFVQLECYKCHEIMGETFPAVAEKERGIGPELS